MSSFDNTPFALRTRGPLPGLGLFNNQQVGDQQFAPAPAPAPLLTPAPAPTSNNTQTEPRGTKRSASPLERPWTPEPINAAKLERSPSPFIKKEPVDKSTYTAFTVPDEEEYDPATAFPFVEPRQDIIKIENEYDPTVPLFSIESHRAAASVKYDPALPSPHPSTRFHRILSHVNGELVEPPTVCFTGAYRNQQLVHMLNCHGSVETDNPQSCGDNCALAVAGAKNANGWPIQCTNPVCVDKRNKRHASVFAPKKRLRTANPAVQPRASTALPLDGFGASSYVPAQPAQAARVSKADQEIIDMNRRMHEDPALYALVHDPRNRGRGQRILSKLHAGYVTPTEMKQEWAYNNLFKNAGALDLGIDLDAIDSTMTTNTPTEPQKPSGIKLRLGKRRAADSKDFDKHDRPAGVELEREPINLPTDNQTPRTFDAMLKQQNGFVKDREDMRSHRLPRNAEAVDDEDGGLRGIIEDEICAVCGKDGKRALEKCTQCRDRFHRVCVGKPDYDAKGYQYPGPWRCDGDGCNKEMTRFHWVCRDEACYHHDYCGPCAKKKVQPHHDDVVAAGGDSTEHQWMQVDGKLGPALKALEEAEKGGFTCSDCDDKQMKKAQDLAQEMFGKKPVSVAEMRAEGKKRKTAQDNKMKEKSFVQGIKDRIRNNAKRGRSSNKTRSSTSTPQRRSTRLNDTSVAGGMRPKPALQPIAETTEDVEMDDAEDARDYAEMFGVE